MKLLARLSSPIILKLLLLSGVVSLGILILTAIGTYAYYYLDIQDKTRLLNRKSSGILLLDRDGAPFFSFDQARSETYVALAQIPVSVQQALIAAEDKEFYDHPGFSVRGMLRAVYVNFINQKVLQGGSTITQELVKNALLTSDRSVLRKYQEIWLSLAITQRYSKADILEMYLNSVYFGAGAFGIEDAAQTYFGIGASQLNTGQAALLVGLLPAPSALSPLDNDPQLARDRQRLVLQEMAEDGYLSGLEAEQLASDPLVYQPKLSDLNTVAPHFALYVRELLIKQYGEERVIRSGFKVKTTLNRNYQDLAQRIVHNEVLWLRANNASNASAVILDPKTGQILAMVGSYDWHDPEFGTINMAVAPRQPGSAFKPLIYAKALEDRDITPATLLEDKPKEYPGGYKPLNYDRRFRGSVTVRRALANSLNIPAVEVMDKVGVSRGLAFVRELGITTLTQEPSYYGLPLILGAGEVPLLELTSAYSAFANTGNREPTVAILEILDKYGRTVDSYQSRAIRVMSEEVAYIISSILSDNRARAEVFGGSLTIGRPAAVKTGTTNDYRDALTVGYTPSLVIGVWVGNTDNTPMDRVAGSLGAAPIWRKLMEEILRGKPAEPFPIPSRVERLMVCPFAFLSGTGATASGYPEYFIKGTEPKVPCPTAGPSPSPSPSAVPTSALTTQPTPFYASPAPTIEPITSPEPVTTPFSTPDPTLSPVLQIDTEQIIP